MAATYTPGTGARVDVPDQSALNDLLVYSILAWVNPTSLAARRIMQKGRVGVAPKGIKSFEMGATGNIVMNIGRNNDTTSANFLSSGTPLAKTNHWYCVLSTFDQNATQTGHLFVGDELTPLTEVSYQTTNNGSGAYDVEATGDNWVVGNNHNNNVGWPGFYGSVVLWNRVFTLPEYQIEQRRWHTLRGEMFRYRPGTAGPSTVFDESGNGRHGTITTALPISDSVPRPLRMKAE